MREDRRRGTYTTRNKGQKWREGQQRDTERPKGREKWQKREKEVLEK